MKNLKKLLLLSSIPLFLLKGENFYNKTKEETITNNQEKIFKEELNVEFDVLGYSEKDLGNVEMMVLRGVDSIYMNKGLTTKEKRETLLHEYTHIIQNNIIKKLKKENTYKSEYDTSKIYSLLISEGSAEAAKHIALGKSSPKGEFKAIQGKRRAWTFYSFCPKDFYKTGANLIYPLIKKQGLEKTLTGLFTTEPPTPMDISDKEHRKEYLEKVEDNSKKYFSENPLPIAKE